MSFFASNDRIYITNEDEKVIFDTSKPMPHIIQTITGTATVDFPSVPCQYWESTTSTSPITSGCSHLEYQCHTEQQYVCGYVQVCGWEMVNGVNQYVCHNEYQCSYQPVQVCGYETVNDPGYLVNQGFDYGALEWNQIVSLGTIDDEIEADFLLVNAVATRTKQGSLADMGDLPCGLPLGATFVANNSSIIECMSDIRDGTPWMTRIMSVFVENGEVKVEFKHSNKDFRAVSTWWGSYCAPFGHGSYVPGIPKTPPQGESSFSFDLTVRLGKFTI